MRQYYVHVLVCVCVWRVYAYVKHTYVCVGTCTCAWAVLSKKLLTCKQIFGPFCHCVRLALILLAILVRVSLCARRFVLFCWAPRPKYTSLKGAPKIFSQRKLLAKHITHHNRTPIGCVVTLEYAAQLFG